MSTRQPPFILLVLLAATACQKSPGQQFRPLEPRNAIDEGTSPTVSLPPQWTATPPEAIRETGSPMELSLPIGNIEKRCVLVRGGLVSGLFTNGLLILADFSEQGGVGELKILSSHTLNIEDLDLAPEYWGTGEESPDKLRLMYETYDESSQNAEFGEIIVLNNQASIDQTIPIDDSWLWLRWKNSEEIAAISEFPNPGSIEIIDAGNGSISQKIPALPQYWNPGGMFPNWWGVSFNQKMDRLVYIQGAEQPSKIILWDLAAARAIWEWGGPLPLQIRPEWSPNQDSVAILVQENPGLGLFIVDLEGASNKWIEIEDAPEYNIGVLQWSPDGRYLALVSFGGGPLLILDTLEMSLIDLCINSASSYGKFLWSPESSHLIVPRYEKPALIIDLERAVGANLTVDRNLKPVAWLKNN